MLDQAPRQFGSRFSANAFEPSCASSEARIGPAMWPWRSHISSRGQSRDSWMIRLDPISASGPLTRDRGGQRQRLGHGAVGHGHAVDQAQLVGPLGGDRVAGQGQLHGHVVGDASRQVQQGPACSHQAALGLGDAELGPGGRHHQVAGQRNLQTAGHGKALDGRDQRLARSALGDPGEATVAHPRPFAGHERLQVHARAEAAPGTGQDADRERVVCVQLVERARPRPRPPRR